ncbi:MAG TPA: hypothetical protein VFR28_07300 [Allosphingosinicella sp.]|nr:hypothetical protein [Allosphingosinicella sp.]
MTDYRSDSSDADRRSTMLGEAIDGAVRKITTGIVIAGGLIGLGIYAHPEPRFDAFAFGNQIIRVDGKTGTIIACEGTRTCQQVLRKGQRLERIKRSDALPAPSQATPLPAAPASGRSEPAAPR